MRRAIHWPLALALAVATMVSHARVGAAAVAAPPAPATLSFLSIGDAGRRTSDTEDVAHQMALALARSNASFVAYNGDNFYENGVTSADDPLWETNFQQLFPKEAFPVPFYATLGNHDYRGSAQAQVDYSKKHGPAGRFTMPSPYYLVQRTLADGTTVDLVFLDTVTLAPSAAEAKARLPPNVAEVKRRQYAWLEATLGASTADWLLVVGHYPVFSSGEHGDTPELIAELLPLLEKHRVDFVVSGHDHTVAHYQTRTSGIQFFINGSGSKLGALDHATAATSVKTAKIHYGFMQHELTRDRLTTRAIDAEGKTTYIWTQRPRGRRQRANANDPVTTKASGNASGGAGHDDKEEAAAVVAPLAVSKDQDKAQLDEEEEVDQDKQQQQRQQQPQPEAQAQAAGPPLRQRGTASKADGDAAFQDLPPQQQQPEQPEPQPPQHSHSLRSSLLGASGRRQRRGQGASSPLAVAGMLLTVVGALAVLAALWRARRRRSDAAQRYRHVVDSARGMGRGVWDDDDVEEYDSDLSNEDGEFQVELPHMA